MALIERMATSLGLATRSEPLPESPEGFAAQVAPPARSTTADGPTTIDAVYRGLQVIETGALQLSVDVWRTLRGITEPTDVPAIVAQPNVDDPGPVFYASTTVCLAARGNAYWHKTKGSDGSVINIDLLDPATVTVERDPKRRQLWYHTPLRSDPFTRAEVSHLKLLRLPGELYGLGPLQAARRQLEGQVAMREYADNWFTDPGHVDALLKTEQQLTADQAKAYKAQWLEQQSMRNGPAVMGHGLDYKPLLLNPAELQWLEAQKFGVTGIARLLGIPSSYMLAPVEGANLTYKNQEQEDLALVRFTLMRYLREIELAISAVLPRTQEARFNVDALLRTDTLTRYQAHKIGLDAGFLSVPEVRRTERLDPRTTLPTPQKETTNA